MIEIKNKLKIKVKHIYIYYYQGARPGFFQRKEDQQTLREGIHSKKVGAPLILPIS